MKMITDYYKNGFKYKLKIRERDIEILSDLELWGILDELQVNAVFHKEKTDMSVKIDWLFEKNTRGITSSARRRMCKFLHAGYVNPLRFEFMNRAYILSSSGHNLLKSLNKNCLPSHQARISPACVKHQLLTAAIGLTMSKFWRLPVLSGRQILHDLHKKIADGEAPKAGNIVPDLIVNDRKDQKFIEVELTQKPNAVYAKIWETYAGIIPENGLLVYFMHNQCACGRILRLAQNLGMEKFYTAPIDEFRARQGRVLMKGTDGREMYFADF